MFSRTFAWLAAAAFLVAMPLMAQYEGPIALDRSFGAGGFGGIPVLGNSPLGAVAIGFVRLPLSGDFLYFSAQQLNGNDRVVATRLTPAGAVNTQWGNQGSLVYSLPVPDYAAANDVTFDARLVVIVEGTAEFVYLIGRKVNALTVARISIADGSFIYNSSTLPIAYASGVGSITAAAPARASTLYFTNSPGVLVAVRGAGSEVNETDFVQVYSDGATLNIAEFSGTNGSITRQFLSINYMAVREDGAFDVAGTATGKAMYMQYYAKSPQVLREIYFDLCGTTSVADGMVRDPSLGADAILATRSNCGPALVRISSIDAIQPQVLWSVPTGVSDDNANCPNLINPCSNTFAAMSETVPGEVLALTPSFRLSHVKASTGLLLGRDELGGVWMDNDLLFEPTYKLGAVQSGPYLVGIAYLAAPFVRKYGLARVATDRLFADGADQ